MTGTVLTSLGLLMDFAGVVVVAWAFLVPEAQPAAAQMAPPAHGAGSGRVVIGTGLILLGLGLQFAGRWAPHLLALVQAH